MRISPTRRPAVRRARRGTFLAVAGLIVATLASIGPVQAATYTLIDEGKIAYPSPQGVGGGYGGPEMLLWEAQGCPDSVWDGNFAAFIKVEQYQGRTLEIRLRAADQTFTHQSIAVKGYYECNPVLVGTGAAGGAITFVTSRSKWVVGPEVYLNIFVAGEALGVGYAIYLCTSASC